MLASRDARHLKEATNFVESYVSKRQTLLILPYSSGLNFALAQRNPLLQTQTGKMTFRDSLAERVAEREKASPPDFIALLMRREPGWDWAFDLSRKDSPRLWSMLTTAYARLQTLGEDDNISLEVYGRKQD